MILIQDIKIVLGRYLQVAIHMNLTTFAVVNGIF